MYYVYRGIEHGLVVKYVPVIELPISVVMSVSDIKKMVQLFCYSLLIECLLRELYFLLCRRVLLKKFVKVLITK